MLTSCTVNKSLSLFTYAANNTINSIAIAFQNINDDIAKRSEKAVLSIRLNGLFIKPDSQHDTITITILDKNSKHYDDVYLIEKSINSS